MLSFWQIVSDCTECIHRHYPSRRTRQFLFHNPQILSKRFQVQRLRWHVPSYGTPTNSFCVFGWKECRSICLCDWCQWKPLQWIKRCHCFSAILLSGKENLLLWHWFEWRTEKAGMMFTQKLYILYLNAYGQDPEIRMGDKMSIENHGSRCLLCFDLVPGLILGLRLVNERRRYKVTSSLIDWSQT